MNSKKAHFLLGLLLLFVLVIKLLVLSNSNMPSYDSYFEMRQIDHIKESGLPLIHDDLSYQGRTNTLNFLFYYFLAFFTLFIPMKLLFIFGGVVITLGSLFLIFLISKKLYANKQIALIVTLIGSLSTVLFTDSLFSLSSTSFFLLIYLGLIFTFITFVKKYQRLVLFVILSVIGTLLTSLFMVMFFGFILYLLLLLFEKLKLRNKEVEILSFAGVFAIWYNLIIYRSLFQLNGISVIWSRIPNEILSSFFQKFSLPVIILLIGIVPFLLGIYAIYQSLFVKRRRYLLFITSLTLVFLGFLFLGLLPFKEGLLFVTVNFIILSGFSLKQINSYFEKMNFPKLKYFLLFLVVLFSIINFIPSLTNDYSFKTPSNNEEVFLSNFSFPSDATILSNIKEGHFIAYTTNRKNFYDTQFNLAPDSEQRFRDSKKIYLSTSKISALSLLNFYDIDYIYVSDLTRKELGVNNFIFEKDPCFELKGNTSGSELYEVKCKLSK